MNTIVNDEININNEIFSMYFKYRNLLFLPKDLNTSNTNKLLLL